MEKSATGSRKRNKQIKWKITEPVLLTGHNLSSHHESVCVAEYYSCCVALFTVTFWEYGLCMEKKQILVTTKFKSMEVLSLASG